MRSRRIGGMRSSVRPVVDTVDRRGMTGAKIREELRKRLIAGSEKDGIGVRRRFVRQRRNMQAAQRHEHAQRPVPVRQPIRAAGVGDVDLDDDQIRQIRSADPANRAAWTCSSTITASSSGRRYAASVARPSGGNSEYLIGRKYGLVASVSAGRTNVTRRGPGIGKPVFRQAGPSPAYAWAMRRVSTLYCKVLSDVNHGSGPLTWRAPWPACSCFRPGHGGGGRRDLAGRSAGRCSSEQARPGPRPPAVHDPQVPIDAR